MVNINRKELEEELIIQRNNNEKKNSILSQTDLIKSIREKTDQIIPSKFFIHKANVWEKMKKKFLISSIVETVKLKGLIEKEEIYQISTPYFAFRKYDRNLGEKKGKIIKKKNNNVFPELIEIDKDVETINEKKSIEISTNKSEVTKTVNNSGNNNSIISKNTNGNNSLNGNTVTGKSLKYMINT